MQFKRNNRSVLLFGGLLIGIFFISALLLNDFTMQQVSYSIDGGFTVTLVLDDRGTGSITQLSGTQFHVNDELELFYLEFTVDAGDDAIDYIEITQQTTNTAAIILRSEHPNIPHVSYTYTIFNIPTLYTFKVYARTVGVGLLDDLTITVDCAGWKDLPESTTTEISTLTAPEMTTEPFSIPSPTIIIIAGGLFIIIFKRKFTEK